MNDLLQAASSIFNYLQSARLAKRRSRSVSIHPILFRQGSVQFGEDMRHQRTSTLFSFYLSLLLLALQLHGRQVNVTVDDQFGDPSTGQVIQYNPPQAWNKGQDCEACTAKPRPISNAHKNTWMDGSFFPAGSGTNGVSGQIISASLPFIGE